jgi:hypothetical protein
MDTKPDLKATISEKSSQIDDKPPLPPRKPSMWVVPPTWVIPLVLGILCATGLTYGAIRSKYNVQLFVESQFMKIQLKFEERSGN